MRRSSSGTAAKCVEREGRLHGRCERQRRDRGRGASGSTPRTRKRLDRRLIELDGTPNKGRLGANAVLGVSLASAKAAAADAGVSLFRHLGGEGATTLPVPMLNVINGGVHADNSIDLQEFMLVPAGADSFSDGLRIAAETYHELKKLLVERGLSTGVGDEGGFAPDLESSEIAIEAILDAAERAGHRDRVAIALDPASSEFFSDGRYRFEGRELAPEEMAGFYGDLADALPARLARGRQRRGRLGRLAAPRPSSSATVCSWSATTSSSRVRSGCASASSAESPTRS